jgi:hypothetical protein
MEVNARWEMYQYLANIDPRLLREVGDLINDLAIHYRFLKVLDNQGMHPQFHHHQSIIK